MTKQKKEKLKKLLDYLQDKIEDCYKEETEQIIKEYLQNLK